VLKKFIKIKGVGKFVDHTASGDVELRKITLIFGDNTRGKTTLCDILRSLKLNDGAYVSGRKTLGVATQQEIDIRLENSTATFRGNAWNSAFPDVFIFDSSFVHENICAGVVVDHEHKRNLYEVMVGENGVHLARRIDCLDDQIRELTKQISSNKAVLEAAVAKQIPAEDFQKLQPDQDIGTKIEAKERELAGLRAAQRSAEQIRTHAGFGKAALPSIPQEFEAVLKTALPDVTGDAEAQLRRHLVEHTKGASELWAGQGVGFIKDNQCPFCAQPLAASAIIDTLRGYFGAGYRELKGKVATLIQAIEKDFGEKRLLGIQKTFADNLIAQEFWSHFGRSMPLLNVCFEPDVAPVLNEVRAQCLDLLKHKQQALFDVIVPGEDFTAALKALQSIHEIIERYNAVAESLNPWVAEVKKRNVAGNLAVAMGELKLLEIQKLRFEPKMQTACAEFVQQVAKKSELERQKGESKEQLDSYTSTVLASHEQAINRYLDQFNAGFRLRNTSRTYLGGKPSSTYQIAINDVPVDLGDSSTPIDQPSFRNTLSAGDRNALALAFFLSQVNQTTDLANKVVVLDDPFTSHDRSRRICTQQCISSLARRAKQVIVLSHDPYFLNLVWKNVPKTETKTLQLARFGSGTRITQWDIEKEVTEEYFRMHERLTKYVHEGLGALREVAKDIRLILEEYLRVKLPNQFSDTDWLGDMIEKIGDSESGTALEAAKDALPELESLNDFSKRYHHATNPNADTELIDDGELQGFARRTLTFIGGF